MKISGKTVKGPFVMLKHSISPLKLKALAKRRLWPVYFEDTKGKWWAVCVSNRKEEAQLIQKALNKLVAATQLPVKEEQR